MTLASPTNSSPYPKMLGQDQLLLLQEEGISVRELRNGCLGSFRNLVEKIYSSWSIGELSVMRNWGRPQEKAQTVIYENSACLLPDDIILLKKICQPAFISASLNCYGIRKIHR